MRHWLRLIEQLVRESRPRAVVWFTGPESPPLHADLAALCTEVDAALLAAAAPEDVPASTRVDFVLLEGDPNWSSTLSRLRWISHHRAQAGGVFPITFVDHVGWPYGRRDAYPSPASVPSGHVHSRRRGGLIPTEPEPVPGRGYAPDRDHAVLAHPFRNGRRTAVEDFLRREPPHLRLVTLPGFHGLAVIAPQKRIDRSQALRLLFDDPGRTLLEGGQVAALEEARIAAMVRMPAAPGERAAWVEEPAAKQLTARLAQAERELAEERSEVRRLASAVLGLRGNVLDLLESNRWRMGDRLGDLSLKLRRRERTETAGDRLRAMVRELETWDLSKKARRRSSPPPGALQDAPGPARAEAVAAGSGPELFHRLVAGAAIGKLRDRFGDGMRRTGELVARARSRVAPGGPKVSVIMPTRDRAEILGDAITSVVEQSYRDWELIVCEDGKPRGSAEVVLGFGDPRIRCLSIPRAGAAAARNRALEDASGEVIAYLDDDNLWHPAFLEVMVDALERRPAYFAACGSYLDVEVKRRQYALRGMEASRFDFEALARENSIDLNTVVHRRELYDLLGGFDETLTRHQDWDLVLRYGFATDFLPVDAFLTLYRRNRKWDQISASRKGQRSWARVRASLDRAFEAGGPPRADTQPLRPVVLVFEGRDRNACARAAALQRALGPKREVRIVAVGALADAPSSLFPGAEPEPRSLAAEAEARDLAAACGGALLYVVQSTAPLLVLARLARALADVPLVIERDLGEVLAGPHRAPGGTGPSAPWETTVVQALSFASVPARLGAALPVSSEQVGVAEDGGDRALPQPGLSPPPVLRVGKGAAPGDLEAIDRELAADGFRIVDADRFASGTELAGEIQALASQSGALLVVPDGEIGTVGARARQAIADAFAARVPVIAVPCEELGPLSDADCLVLASGAPRDVQAKVAAVLRRPERSSQLTARAWHHARRRYSPAAAASALDLVFARLERAGGGAGAGRQEGSPSPAVEPGPEGSA